MRFQLSEDNFRSIEGEAISAIVTKNQRLANPVTLILTPYTIAAAEESGQPLPPNTPSDNNPYFSNRARGE